jgi:hypothetical protein
VKPLVTAIVAPVALADGPGTGDQSPSYGGNGRDRTAPYLRATILTRHLATLSSGGKLKVSVAASEGALVGLTGKLTARAPGRKALSLKLRGTSLLFQRAGQKRATLTLSPSSRRNLGRLVGARGTRATVTITGLGADRAHNKRHLKKSSTLRR